MTFTYVDLFAGIGGFHLALSQLGGTATFVSEIDDHARSIYERNLSGSVQGEISGDIIPLTESRVDPIIGPHDVLAAGFPCQPFSKSGFQRGVNETRGTLFYNIAKILEARKPRVVILENVRNLVGPNHRHTWALIRRTLRDLGYRTPEQPTVFSPHLLPEDLLGAPQIRERVFIVGVYVGPTSAWEHTDDEPLAVNKPVSGWHPSYWNLEDTILQPDLEVANLGNYLLSEVENEIIDTWQAFLDVVGYEDGPRLPGHPIWADYFTVKPRREEDWPDWKIDFAIKNSALFREHRVVLEQWRRKYRPLKRDRKSTRLNSSHEGSKQRSRIPSSA
jgi:DNA (cytosine-5)-methyltransferase 1